MTDYTIEFSALIGAANKAAGDALAVKLGFTDAGFETFTFPISSDGAEPATHYGFSTLIRPDTMAWLENALTTQVFIPTDRVRIRNRTIGEPIPITDTERTSLPRIFLFRGRFDDMLNTRNLKRVGVIVSDRSR